MSFQPDKIGSVSPSYAQVSEIMKSQTGVKRYVCVGTYIDQEGKPQVFVPKLTFSVFHGDTPLIQNVDTMGYADIPVGQLPLQANGPTGFNTDERGKYIFYTAFDGKEVKIYQNGDDLVPEGAQAYKVVHGFLQNDDIRQFSSVGMSTTSYNMELLASGVDANTLKLLG